MNSLRHIKPQDDKGQQWQRREGSVIRLWNPESEDVLLTEETERGEFDVTGFALSYDLRLIGSQIILPTRDKGGCRVSEKVCR